MDNPVGLTLDGLDLSTMDEFGVQWTTDPSLSGWGSPSSTIDIKAKSRGHGAWAGRSYFGHRSIAAGGLIIAPSQAALSDAIDRLNEACGLDDRLLTVTEEGRSRWCMVRREDEVLAPMLSPTVAKWSIQVVALDHRKFGAPLTQSTGLPSSTGGLTIPYTIPYSIDSVRVSGQASLTNPGNEVGPVVVRIDGPVIGPVITHVASGLAVTFAASLELGVGEWITVDMESHQVLAQGQAGRANWITERGWCGFEPGPNVYGFGAAVHSPAARMTVTATPADK